MYKIYKKEKDKNNEKFIEFFRDAICQCFILEKDKNYKKDNIYEYY